VGCPYEGAVAPERVADVAARLHERGCYEVSLGDTIGVGTPKTVSEMLDVVAARVPIERVAGHFHDTYGMGVANAYAAYQHGVRTFDGSVGGLGGCPYAKGATGNVATEELVYLFHHLGADTGVDLDALVDVAAWIGDKLGKPLVSRVARAVRAKRG
jgi:hydroxymethylglutaryl-CoA lyase